MGNAEFHERFAELDLRLHALGKTMRRSVLLTAIVSATIGAAFALLTGDWFRRTFDSSKKLTIQSLTIEGKDAGGAILLGVEDDGTAAMSFRGRDDAKRAMIATSDDGTTLLTLFDGAGEQRVHLGIVQGSPVLLLSDELGGTRFVLNLDERGVPRLRLKDQQGATTHQLPSRE